MNPKTLVLFTMLGVSAAASAQDIALDEILVTATRRAESVQDITTNVVAFGAEDLAASSIVNSMDLQQRAPGLVFSSNGSFGQPYIRGIGSDIISPGGDAPVAVFNDGAYQARPTSSIVDFYDVERVEVLKGPQGTLYGRNATGGALNIISADPVDEFQVNGSASYGNFDAIKLKGAVNAPLGERAALRVAAFHTDRDGYTDDILRDVSVDNEDAWSVRGKLKFDPTDALSLVFTAEHVNEDSTRNNGNKIILAPGLPIPVIDLAPLFGYPPPAIPADPRELRNDFAPAIDLEQTRLHLKADWDLGFAQLLSITGYTKVENVGEFDLDGTEVSYAYNREDDYSRTVTQSLQLSGSAEAVKLQWIVGGEYLDEKATQNFDARLWGFFFPPGTPILGSDSPMSGIVWDSRLDTEAWSVYVDLRFDVTDTVRLVAGGRYSRERKEADFTQTIIDPFGILTGGVAPLLGGRIVIPAQPRNTFSDFSPSFALEYRPAADLLLYVSATNGFKSGGFNLLNTAETFQPESIWSYEGGIKAEWLDNRVRTNLSAFYYDYSDLQVIRFDGLSNFVRNADARIYGVEGEFLARPTDRFTLDAGFAYLDAEYTEYLTINSNFPAQGTVDLDGFRMPKAPEITFTAGAEYRAPVPDYGNVTLRGELRYLSEIFFDQFQTAALNQDGYALLNARATFESADGRWHVAAFGRNLTDKTYLQSMVRVDAFFGTVANYGAPRTYGVEVGVNF